MCSIGKLLLLTLNEREEKVIDKIIAAISDYIRLEPMQIAPVSILSFRGLEIRQHQRKVFQDGQEVNLTRLEYSTLVFLASNPGIVLTKTQIFGKLRLQCLLSLQGYGFHFKKAERLIRKRDCACAA